MTRPAPFRPVPPAFRAVATFPSAWCAFDSPVAWTTRAVAHFASAAGARAWLLLAGPGLDEVSVRVECRGPSGAWLPWLPPAPLDDDFPF